ncbi:MAG TPA: hypothetical protein VNR70_17680 [Steroidobacteraceae bacterium]|nr:hypothetical protein [Steroidobacteraceae bacterium]
MNSRGWFVSAKLRKLRRRIAAPLTAMLFAGVAACNGTAVVTLTATASTDTFLTYRVGLVSVELQTSSGSSAVKILPTSTTVDLANLVNLSEVLGAATVAKSNYTAATVTVDYSSAAIVFDNGTLNGVTLTPVGTNGQALGQVQLTLTLDPNDKLSVATNKISRLALDFKLAASNIVNATAKTVTVTPLIVASASAIDAKQVRIRGSSVSTDTTNGRYTTGVTPFDFPVAGAGQVVITPTDATTYEINGTAYTGASGLTQLAAVGSNSMIDTIGSMTSSSSTTTTTTSGTTTTSTSTNVSFAATQVLAGTSVQSSSLDRVSGIVAARSGNSLAIENGTLIGADGTNTYLTGTATVDVGSNTAVTLVGQGSADSYSIGQISVGSLIYAYGTATTPSSGNVTLDASAGRVRLGPTAASGLVTVVGSGALTLSLSSLGGRLVAPFDFVGTGSTTSGQASAGAYLVTTGSLDLTYSTVGVPVEVTGYTTSFGAAPADFTASTLLDPTTISAELVLDWGAGTAAPFTTYDSSAISVDPRNTSIGTRHQIQVGAESINIVGLASDPLIEPNSAGSNLLFAIGHAVSGSVSNYSTYSAFITELQSELNGSVLATGMTAAGQYTTSSYVFSATSITLVLNN